MKDSFDNQPDFNYCLVNNNVEELINEDEFKYKYDVINEFSLNNNSKQDKFGKPYIFNFVKNQNNLFAIAADSNQNTILNEETFEVVAKFSAKDGHKKDVITDLKFAKSNPNLIYTSSKDGIARCYDLREKRSDVNIFCSNTYSASSPKLSTELPLLCIDLNTDDKLLCSGTEAYEENVYNLFWDVRKPSPLGAYWDSHTEDIMQVKFNPVKDTLLLSGSMDGLINVFDLEEGTESDALRETFNIETSVEKMKWVNEFAFLCLTTISTLQYWKVDDISPTFTIKRKDVAAAINFCSPVQQMVDCFKCEFSDDFILVTCNSLGAVHLTRIDSHGKISALAILRNKHRTSVRCADVDTKNGHVITCGEDGFIYRWAPSSSWIG